MDFPDISYNMQMIQNSFREVAYEISRSSIIMRPTLLIVNNEWQCKYGDVIGKGETPDDAMQNFDKEVTKYLKPHFYLCKCGEEVEVTHKTYMKNYPCPKCGKYGQWTKQPF